MPGTPTTPDIPASRHRLRRRLLAIWVGGWSTAQLAVLILEFDRSGIVQLVAGPTPYTTIGLLGHLAVLPLFLGLAIALTAGLVRRRPWAWVASLTIYSFGLASAAGHLFWMPANPIAAFPVYVLIRVMLVMIDVSGIRYLVATFPSFRQAWLARP